MDVHPGRGVGRSACHRDRRQDSAGGQGRWGGSAPHLVAALGALGVVLGQVQVSVKSNEIPALRTLLDAFDLVGAVITADAMHTQTATATYVVGRGGHYVFTVKANQLGLFRRCKALPWAQIRATSTLDRPRAPGAVHDQGRRRS